MKPFLIRWASTCAGVVVAAWLTSIEVAGLLPVLVAGLLLALVQVYLRPVLLVAGAPLILLSGGLFLVLANAGILWLIGLLVVGFKVPGFITAVFGSLWCSASAFFVHSALREKKPLIEFPGSPGGEAATAEDGLKRAKGRTIR